MTLIGWRVFGGVLRSTQVREAEGEAHIRIVGQGESEQHVTR